MNQIKVSIFIRNQEAVTNYEQDGDRKFWNDLSAKLSEKTGITADFKGGYFVRTGEFSSERSASYFREAMDTVLTELLGGTALDAIVVSVTETETASDKKEPERTPSDPIGALRRLFGDNAGKAEPSAPAPAPADAPAPTPPADDSLFGRMGTFKTPAGHPAEQSPRSAPRGRPGGSGRFRGRVICRP